MKTTMNEPDATAPIDINDPFFNSKTKLAQRAAEKRKRAEADEFARKTLAAFDALRERDQATTVAFMPAIPAYAEPLTKPATEQPKSAPNSAEQVASRFLAMGEKERSEYYRKNRAEIHAAADAERIAAAHAAAARR